MSHVSRRHFGSGFGAHNFTTEPGAWLFDGVPESRSDDVAAIPRPSELVVQPDLHEMNRRGNLLPAEGLAKGRVHAASVVGTAAVHEHVFELSGPVIPHGVFDAAAHSEGRLRF